MEKLDWPFLFRVHAKPDESSIQEFCKAVNFFGILATPKDFSNPKSLQKLFHELENHPARQTIHYLLLRSMQQAVYSEKNLGHFGLSSEEYTHFTSPIRRYPDLIVHRLIKSSLGGAKSLTKKQKSELNEEIAEISMHCSDKERVSMAAEREVIKLKKVRFIEKYLGDEFEGSVSGVKEKGFFVELTEFFVDGFVPLSDLGDDFYRYIPEKMALVGRRSHRRIKMGDFVKVQVARVDIAQLQVEFHLIEHQPAHRRGAKALKD
jgi:ribonuclease R